MCTVFHCISSISTVTQKFRETNFQILAWFDEISFKQSFIPKYFTRFLCTNSVSQSNLVNQFHGKKLWRLVQLLPINFVKMQRFRSTYIFHIASNNLQDTGGSNEMHCLSLVWELGLSFPILQICETSSNLQSFKIFFNFIYLEIWKLLCCYVHFQKRNFLFW